MAMYASLETSRVTTKTNPYCVLLQLFFINPDINDTDVRVKWTLEIPSAFEIKPKELERKGTQIIRAKSGKTLYASWTINLGAIPEAFRSKIVESMPVRLSFDEILIDGMYTYDPPIVRKLTVERP